MIGPDMQFYQKLKQLNHAYHRVFENYQDRSQSLNRKNIGQIVSEAYGLLQVGTTEQRNQTKEHFLKIFREFIETFISQYILKDLSKTNDQQTIKALLDRWNNFKKFTFLYFLIFKDAHSYYQSAYKSYECQGITSKLDSNDSIFPIASIALQYFYSKVYLKLRLIIYREIRKSFALQRSGSNHMSYLNKDDLRTLLQIVYSCGLKQTGRIGSMRGINNQFEFQFYKETKNRDIEQFFENDVRNSEYFMATEILNTVINDSDQYYKQYYAEKLSILNPLDDFTKVASIIREEEQRSQFYFFTAVQKNAYMDRIKQCLIVMNLEERLRKQNSLKFYLQQYNYQSGDYIEEIRIFIKTVFKAKKLTLGILKTLIQEHLIETGNKINEKITKRRQHISDMIVLKKSINAVIEEAMEKQIGICIVRDKCFRKILDSIEVSRNLADYTDFKIKECIKMKLNEEDTYDRIKDLFLILENLAATDSFLIYHQEMLGKRLIDSLNEPKLETQLVFLKKLAEKLGSISVSSHTSMIRDIENSQQLTQKFHKKLPFCNFRWSCRIISQPFWPDNINKPKIQIKLPEILRLHAETVGEMFHEDFQYRYLNWKTDKGYSLFEGKFPSGKFRFQCENIFMMLLFHINEASHHQILYGNLKQKVVMNKQSDNQFLMRCIGVLIENGLVERDKMIEGQTYKNIGDGQLLKVNMGYKPKEKTKPNQVIIIRISQQMYKSMHMTTVQQGKIMRERQKIVEAVLVKLLKHSHSTGNNSMTFQQLYKGIKQHHHLGNFQFSESVVKQRLQELIHRGYCERDENDRKIYHYVA